MVIPQQLRGTLALTERSLRLDAREWQQHRVRGGLLLALFLVVMIGAANTAYHSALGLHTFSGVIYANLLCLTLLGGVYFASAISEEKDEDTLGLLKMAGLSPAAILCGKLVPRLVNVLLLMVVQLPFAMLCITLGGVSVEQIVAAYVALAAYTLLLAGAGLFVSVISAGTRRASSIMATLLALWLLAVPLLSTVTGFALSSNRSPVASLLRAGVSALLVPNPFYRISLICRPTFSSGWWSSQVLWSLIVGGAGFAGSWAVFERATRFSQRTAESRPLSVRLSSLFRRKTTSRPPISRAWRYAVAWKDFYFTCGGWSLLLWKAVALLALVIGLETFVLYMSYTSARTVVSMRVVRESFGWICLTVGLVTVAIEIPVLVTRVFQEEIRGKTIQPLLMLPTSPLALIGQKLVAVALSPIPAFGLVALGIAVLPLRDNLELLSEMSRNGTFLMGFLSSYLAMVVLAARLALTLRWGAVPIAFMVVHVLGWMLLTFAVSALGRWLGIWRVGDAFFLIATVVFGAMAVYCAMDFVRKFAQQALR